MQDYTCLSVGVTTWDILMDRQTDRQTPTEPTDRQLTAGPYTISSASCVETCALNIAVCRYRGTNSI